MHNIYDLSFNQIQELIRSKGFPPYRSDQIWIGLYKHFFRSADQFTTLPLKLRQELACDFTFDPIERVNSIETPDQKTSKVLFSLDNNFTFETVLMKYDNRRTLCISCQVGCGIGCVFCATGQMGYKRNLSCGEIVAQVLYFAHQLNVVNEKISNIVFMGMGEPFHNYDSTMEAIDRFNHPKGFNFGARRITVSTVGIIPGIRKFTLEKRQVNLAVSLHSTDDKIRTSIIPINRKFPVDHLLDACKEYVEQTRRRITFEWALINGLNDSLDHAKELINRLKIFRSDNGSFLCQVNIIPLNLTEGYSGQPPKKSDLIAFREVLMSARIPCTIRMRRGIDIQAGCGQLASKTS